MPNISTTLYVSDDVYEKKYLPHKDSILKMMREEVRKELSKIKEE